MIPVKRASFLQIGFSYPTAREILDRVSRTEWQGETLANAMDHEGKKEGRAAVDQDPFPGPIDIVAGGTNGVFSEPRCVYLDTRNAKVYERVSVPSATSCLAAPVVIDIFVLERQIRLTNPAKLGNWESHEFAMGSFQHRRRFRDTLFR